MRLPRVRFTLRRLMIVVAVAAVLMAASNGLARLRLLSSDYRARAEEHAGIEATLRRIIASDGADTPVDISPGAGLRSRRFTARAVADYEAALRRKYERAARYPWLRVKPDPWSLNEFLRAQAMNIN
jgi:hypothetical protein